MLPFAHAFAPSRTLRALCAWWALAVLPFVHARAHAHALEQSVLALERRGPTLSLELAWADGGDAQNPAGGREPLDWLQLHSLDGAPLRWQRQPAQWLQDASGGHWQQRASAEIGAEATHVRVLRPRCEVEACPRAPLWLSLRLDLDRGVLSEAQAQALGVLSPGQALELRLDGPAPWQAARAIVDLGAEHIQDGLDHLLFLLTLLLVAPLRAHERRWVPEPNPRRVGWRALGVVSAFTLGHSLSLAAAALGWVHAPEQPVEVLVAASIAVAAVHALRPLWPGREAWVAAGFGLVHGLAFAEALLDLGYDGPSRVRSLLAFNLGVEAMQLLIVLCTLPWLVWLRDARGYTALRVGGASVAGLAALLWIGERSFAWPNPLEPVLLVGAAQAPWLLMALVVAAAVHGWRRERPRDMTR